MKVNAIADNWNQGVSYLCRPMAFVSKMPGIWFSKYTQAAYFQSALVTMERFRDVMNATLSAGGYTVPTDIPYTQLLIRVAAEATIDDREDIINGLRPFFPSDNVYVSNTLKLLEAAETSTQMLSLFLTIVGVIAMVLCFFILWLSFTANVQENTWEFGVLRAIGLNHVEVVMLYIYEATTIVVTSALLGTVIGILVACSLTLQFNLFTEMPFVMRFPTSLYCVVLVLALICATVGSYFPVRNFMKRSIADIIRRQ